MIKMFVILANVMIKKMTMMMMIEMKRMIIQVADNG